MNQIFDFEKHLKEGRHFLDILSIVLVVLIGIYDYWVGSEISVTLFYLLPILISSWFGKKWSGYIVALISSAAYVFSCWHIHEYITFSLLFWNISLRMVIFFFFVYFITQIRKKVIELNLDNVLSPRIDQLTRILNGRSLYEIMEIEAKRLERYKKPVAIVYMDIDDLKSINNSFGNTTGDHLLFTLAKAMKNNIRTSDVLARIGGDEFVFLLPETGMEGVQAFVAKMQNLLSRVTDENRWPVTFSFGATLFLKAPDSFDKMIRIPEEQMHLAKVPGNNSVRYSVYE